MCSVPRGKYIYVVLQGENVYIYCSKGMEIRYIYVVFQGDNTCIVFQGKIYIYI